jgi:hypothetical protein
VVEPSESQWARVFIIEKLLFCLSSPFAEIQQSSKDFSFHNSGFPGAVRLDGEQGERTFSGNAVIRMMAPVCTTT